MQGERHLEVSRGGVRGVAVKYPAVQRHHVVELVLRRRMKGGQRLFLAFDAGEQRVAFQPCSSR